MACYGIENARAGNRGFFPSYVVDKILRQAEVSAAVTAALAEGGKVYNKNK